MDRTVINAAFSNLIYWGSLNCVVGITLFYEFLEFAI